MWDTVPGSGIVCPGPRLGLNAVEEKNTPPAVFRRPGENIAGLVHFPSPGPSLPFSQPLHAVSRAPGVCLLLLQRCAGSCPGELVTGARSSVEEPCPGPGLNLSTKNKIKRNIYRLSVYTEGPRELAWLQFLHGHVAQEQVPSSRASSPSSHSCSVKCPSLGQAVFTPLLLWGWHHTCVLVLSCFGVQEGHAYSNAEDGLKT